MVDEKLIVHCNTLPEANLALIAARGELSAFRVGRR
jgi:hypothetical protein